MRKKPAAKLSMLGFFAITVVMVMDLHEYTVFATSGFQLVFFLLAGGVLWFLPVALCSAEMATTQGWEEGGIFTWVEKTLGRRFGFAAVFFQWFQVTVGFITMLYFVYSAISACFDMPLLDTNPFIKFAGIMLIFWGLTFFQLGGVKRTEFIGRLCLIFGIAIPATVLAVLSVWYIAGGNSLQIDFSPGALIPDFSQPSTLVVFVAFILSYAGIEASASYANELSNPKREYPRAILLVVIAAILLNTIGGLSIAAVVPVADLSMSGGILQALQDLFGYIGKPFIWLGNVVALMIALGVIGEVSSWILGPAREMYAAAQQGILPSVFKKVNAKNVPVPLVLVQGIIVTIWAAVLTFGGGGDNLSFLAAISLTAAIYLLAYLLLFVAYFVTVFKRGDTKSTYQVPGGRVGKCLVAGLGLLSSLFALAISFVPPDTISGQNSGAYETILVVGVAVVAALPFIIYAFRNRSALRRSMKHLRSFEVPWFTHPIARGEHHIEPSDEDIITK